MQLELQKLLLRRSVSLSGARARAEPCSVCAAREGASVCAGAGAEREGEGASVCAGAERAGGERGRERLR